MSTYEYRPNGENTLPVYKIGTIGWELPTEGLAGVFADIFRVIYPVLPVSSLFLAATFAIDPSSAVPTYGLWSGPGWSSGSRGSSVKWETLPCFSDNIENSANDITKCYSLVDAICKTHDWRYYDAKQKFKNDEAGYKEAILKADLGLLKDINNAYKTGIFAETEGPWVHDIYTGILNNNKELVLDVSESLYMTGLVPLFMTKIATVDVGGLVVAEAKGVVKSILAYITIDEKVLQDPADPSKKTIYSVKGDLIITQKESALSSDAWIVDLNSEAKPVNINIAYGVGSTKADDIFVIEDGVIRINSGIGHNEITIAGATNDTIANYTFEINDGGGNDTYYLDSNFDYKLIDSEANAIFIEDDDGKWMQIGALYKNAEDTFWESEDGSITLTDNTITLANDSTIDLGDAFEDGDFGINLIPIPVTPTDPDAYHSITGDFAPIDFDPDTEGIQTDKDEWGNIITDPDKPEPGRADALHDTTANDLLNGDTGNDFIVSDHGGNDWLIGGDGNDEITANYDVNTVVIEGGAGTDVIYGGSGNDKIFCDNYGEMDDFIAAGETAESIDIRGDVASGGVYRPYGEEQILDGDDYIYGSNASDVLLGGTGKDLLVGGGGDDVILGDKALAYVDYDADWTFNIVDYGVSFENMGIYAPLPDDVKYALQDDDVIYAGTGNDYICSMDNARGNNVAYVRNIIPFRQKIKHQKHHNKWRRFSQCENLRRVAA